MRTDKKIEKIRPELENWELPSSISWELPIWNDELPIWTQVPLWEDLPNSKTVKNDKRETK
jgi:hypothetical protein